MRRLLDRFLIAMAPAERRDWVAAMLAEADCLQGRDRLDWYAAAAAVSFSLRLRGWGLALTAVAFALIMVLVDWTSGALLPALALIGLAAAVLTRSSMGSSRVALMVAGGTLPAAHAIANWVPRLRPHYQYAPLHFRDWAILLAVAAIGLCTVRVADAYRAARNFARSDG